MSNMVERMYAGDTLDFVDSIDDYPASDGWTLKYLLIPTFTTPSQAVITLTATTEGTEDYRVTVAASATALWKPGVYTWARFVDDGSRRVTFDEPATSARRLEILADPEQATAGYDTRTQAEAALDQLRALFATFSAERGTVQEYQIGGRLMRFRSTADILQQINYWERMVEQERRAARIASGLAPANKIFVRF